MFEWQTSFIPLVSMIHFVDKLLIPNLWTTSGARMGCWVHPNYTKDTEESAVTQRFFIIFFCFNECVELNEYQNISYLAFRKWVRPLKIIGCSLRWISVWLWRNSFVSLYNLLVSLSWHLSVSVSHLCGAFSYLS